MGIAISPAELKEMSDRARDRCSQPQPEASRGFIERRFLQERTLASVVPLSTSESAVGAPNGSSERVAVCGNCGMPIADAGAKVVSRQ